MVEGRFACSNWENTCVFMVYYSFGVQSGFKLVDAFVICIPLRCVFLGFDLFCSPSQKNQHQSKKNQFSYASFGFVPLLCVCMLLVAC